jgi:hypothetical protein
MEYVSMVDFKANRISHVSADNERITNERNVFS